MQQGNLSTEKNQPDRLKKKSQPNRKNMPESNILCITCNIKCNICNI